MKCPSTHTPKQRGASTTKQPTKPPKGFVTVAIARGKHPDPSRTRKLSLPALMVLHTPVCGRVRRRRTTHHTCPHNPPGCGGTTTPPPKTTTQRPLRFHPDPCQGIGRSPIKRGDLRGIELLGRGSALRPPWLTNQLNRLWCSQRTEIPRPGERRSWVLKHALGESGHGF